MKSTPTLCELLIFIICMCILLFCFKSFFLSVLLLCFPAVLAHFVRHFPVARGRLCAVLLFPASPSGIQGLSSFSAVSTSTADAPQYQKIDLYQGIFRFRPPSIQFQTRKVFINLYHCTIRFKHTYHQARERIGFIMHWFIIIMKFHPCNQLKFIAGAQRAQSQTCCSV